MAISYVGGKGAGTAGQGGGSIGLTTGLTGGSGGAPIAGDLVVVTVSVGTAARAPTIAISTPSGYTPLTAQRTTATTYDTNIQTCYKVMGSTPDTSVTIPASGNNADGISYAIQVFRGVNQTTPMDTTPTYATGSGTNSRPDPAAITPVTTGAWIVVCGGGATSTGAVYTAAYLTNLITNAGPDTNDSQIGCGYYTGWTSGAYNPAQFSGGSATTADSWGATTLALRPFVAVTHDTTGALSGQIGAIAGNAARADPPVVHDTSGALSGQIGSIVGASSRFRAFATTGVMTGQGSLIEGSSARTRQHPASGGITGQPSEIVGSAARLRVMASSGALSGQGGLVDGAAERTGGATVHGTSGDLFGVVSIMDGASARSGGSVLHDTSGVLLGQSSSIDGFAELDAPVVADTHDGYFQNLWIKAAEREKKKRKDFGRLEEELAEIEHEIVDVKSKPIPTRQIVIKSTPLPPIEAQAKILEALIVQRARLLEEIEEEEILLLM